MKNKNFDKNLFADFFGMLEGKTLSKEEPDLYIDTFTKYLNVTADDVANSAKVFPTTIPSRKSFKTEKWSHFIFGIIVAAYIIACPIIIALIALVISNLNITTDLLTSFIVTICVAVVFYLLFGRVFTSIEKFYFKYKNSFKFHIGDICVWDPNGMYRSFCNEGSNIESPCIVQISAITKEFVYVFATGNGNRFKIPIDKANLLFKVSTLDEKDFKLIIRYPLALPVFSFEDCKILEAAMILAKMKNEPKIFEALSGVLSKVRFYNDHPYGDYNSTTLSYKQISEAMKSTLDDMIIGRQNEDDFDDDENDEDFYR